MSDDFNGAVFHIREADENFKGAIYHVKWIGDSGSHNKGYYATEAELEEAYPTAEAGDWAIVNTTDTVWVWDTDNSEWVDSDQKGQVISVNNKTGTVVLTAEDVNAIPQYSTVPAASSTNVDDIIQYTGTTSGSYTNGYFYKNSSSTTPSSATASQTTGSSLSDVAVVVATFETQIATSGSYVFTSDGTDWSYDGNTVDLTDYGITYTGTPVADDVITVVYTAESTTYAWTRIDVQPTVDPLPDQTGNAGKFLVTDGTDASWSNTISNNSNSVSSLTLDNAASGGYKPFLKCNQAIGSLLLYGYGTSGFCISTSSPLEISKGIIPGPSPADIGFSNSTYQTVTKWNCVYTDKISSAYNKFVTVPSVNGKIALQIDTLPTAASSYEGVIYQYTGTTDSTYTNGHFYKCVSDGQTPATYSWEEISFSSGLPSQTGNSGKFLITDGTDASWGNTVRNVKFDASNSSNVFNETFYKKSTNDERFVISYGSSVGIDTHLGWSFGKDPFDSTKHIFFYENNAGGASYTAHPIIGKSDRKFENLYITTVNNGSDITVPAVGGTLALQIATLPTADSTYEGTIYQYTGATDSTYTNGRFYKCVSDGGNPATYSWEEISFGGGGNYLSNTATGTYALTVEGAVTNAPEAINIGNGSAVISQGDIAIGRNAQASGSNENSVAIGFTSRATGAKSVAIGGTAHAYGNGTVSVGKGSQAGNNANDSYAVAIGYNAQANALRAIQIGGGLNATNSVANTMKVANANGNFEIMSADGTIPTDRFTTTPSADGTYVPTLTISSGVATRSWSAPSGGGSTGTTASLVVANWSSNTQTVNVTGVTASNNVIVAPAPASQADYTAAGIICTAQGAGTLTFSCQTVPSSAITVNVLILG